MYDVIIIGSGISGLTCANYAVSTNKKVLLLEKENYVGGLSSGFYRDGFYFDTGLFSVPYDSIRPFIDELGISQKIDFIYDHAIYNINGYEFEVRDFESLYNNFVKAFKNNSISVEQYLSGLKKHIDIAKKILTMGNPLSSTGIKFFITILEYIFKIGLKDLRFLKTELNKPLKDYVDSVFKKRDETYWQFYNWGYDGISKTDAGFMWYALMKDIAYPKHGFLSFANAFKERFLEHSGELRLNSEVETILLKKNKAYGVRLKNNEIIKAKNIVAACDLKKTIFKYVGPEYFSENLVKMTKESEPSEPFTTLYIELDMGNDELRSYIKTSHYSFMPFYRIHSLYEHKDDPDFFKKTGITFRSLSMIDSNLAPIGKSSLIIHSITPSGWMNNWGTGKLRKKNSIYYNLKNKVKEDILEILSMLIPMVKKRIIRSFIATELTYEKFTYNTGGANVGFSWNVNKASIQEISSKNYIINDKVKNLFFSSMWIVGKGGLPSCMASAKKVSLHL